MSLPIYHGVEWVNQPWWRFVAFTDAASSSKGSNGKRAFFIFAGESKQPHAPTKLEAFPSNLLLARLIWMRFEGVVSLEKSRESTGI
jgi:hypothetical protein